MCLEITYSAIAKYPKFFIYLFFFDALETGKNEQSHIF